MSDKLEINKELVLSTSHVPDHTATFINLGTPMFIVIQDGFTFRMYVSEDSAIHDCEGHAELLVLAKLAQDNDCKWLVLDCDAATYDELPTFEW